LAYRVVNIVSGELNDAAAKKYDIEVRRSRCAWTLLSLFGRFLWRA
jgi:hypothetical protein